MTKMQFNCECCGRDWEFARAKKGPLYCIRCIEHLGGLGVGPEQRKKKLLNEDTQQWYTINEAADHIRVSERLIHQLIQEGRIISHRIGGQGHRRITRGNLEAVMQLESGDYVTALTAENDPVLGKLWDNERDAKYDQL